MWNTKDSKALTFFACKSESMYKKITEVIHDSQALMEICITPSESEGIRSSKLT